MQQQRKIATANDIAAIMGGTLTTEAGITIVIPSPEDQFAAAVSKIRELMRREGQVEVKDIVAKKIPDSELRLRQTIFTGLEFPLLELESAWARQRHKTEAIAAIAEQAASQNEKKVETMEPVKPQSRWASKANGSANGSANVPATVSSNPGFVRRLIGAWMGRRKQIEVKAIKQG